ncbi:MAG: hypothetical protein RL103_344 [Pseudomonadota bacterium]|jgi:hypothetical protein
MLILFVYIYRYLVIINLIKRYYFLQEIDISPLKTSIYALPFQELAKMNNVVNLLNMAQAISAINSISTQAPIGNCATPKALRA